VVDKDGGETIPDGATHQGSHDGGIYASRDAAHDATLLPDRRADLRDAVVDEGSRVPVRGAAAHVHAKVTHDLAAARRVHDFRVELQPIEAPGNVHHGSNRRVFRMSEHGKAGRERLNAIAMAHPDLEHARKVAEERILGAIHRYRSRAILAAAARGDTSTQPLRKQLHPVADAEHRQRARQDVLWQCRGTRVVHAARPSRKDKPPWVQRRDSLGRGIPGQQLGIDVALAHATHDELAVLRAIVKYDDRLAVFGYGGTPHGLLGARRQARCMPQPTTYCTVPAGWRQAASQPCAGLSGRPGQVPVCALQIGHLLG